MKLTQYPIWHYIRWHYNRYALYFPIWYLARDALIVKLCPHRCTPTSRGPSRSSSTPSWTTSRGSSRPRAAPAASTHLSAATATTQVLFYLLIFYQNVTDDKKIPPSCDVDPFPSSGKKNKRAVVVQLMSACVSLGISCTTTKKGLNLFFFPLHVIFMSCRAI